MPRQNAQRGLPREEMEIPRSAASGAGDAAPRDFEDQLGVQSKEVRNSQGEFEEARNRYAELYDFVPVGYLTLSHSGRVLEINLAGAALLGRDRNYLVGAPFSLFLKGREDIVKFLAHVRACGETAETSTTRLRLKSAKGGTIPVQLVSRPLADVRGLCFTALTDLSLQVATEQALELKQEELSRLNAQLEKRVEERAEELRKSEALKQTIFDAISSEIVVLDADGKIIERNKESRELHSCALFHCAQETPNYLETCRCAAYEDQDGAAHVALGIAAVLSGQSKRFQLEYRRIAPPQEERWIALTVTPLDGSGVVLVHDDVTERKVLEREILEISEKERRRIGQDLHDGLCQHLAGTALMATVLARSLSQKSRPEGGQASQIASLMSNAVEQARNLARGLHPVEVESRGLTSALQELADSVDPAVRCQFRCARDITVTENNIAVNFYRIAQEAVNNALKHGRPKQVVITLQKTAGALELTVEDDGIGFPASVRREGMGIQIMKYRASTMGAKLDAANATDAGVRVRCSVPLATLR